MSCEGLAPIVFSLRPLQAKNTLFLDRDGVLNHVVMRDGEVSSPRCLDEFKLAEDVMALSAIDPTQWNLVIVSNQPDLTRKLIDMAFLLAINRIIGEVAPINAAYICPHTREAGCFCRKPASGMIVRFREDYPNLQGKEMFIGDRKSDWVCAQAANIPFVLRVRPHNLALKKDSFFSISDLNEVPIILNSEV